VELNDRIGKIYKCSCGCAALEMTNDDFDEHDPRLDVCIWRLGSPNSGRRTWRDRIRWCWNMLRLGQLYTDDIILDFNTVQELRRGLEEWSNQAYIKLMEKDDANT